MSAGKDETDSLFSVLRPAKPAPLAPEAPTPPAAAPAAAIAPAPAAPLTLEPLLKRLAQLEERSQKPDSALIEKIERLERQLLEAHQKAISAQAALAEREQAQLLARRESEALLQSVSASRRSEELDRQLREQAAAHQRRIEDLEGKLLKAAADAGASASREDLVRLKEMVSSELAAMRTASGEQSRGFARSLDDLGASFRQLREQGAAHQRRIEELERKFLAASADAGAGASREDLVRLKDVVSIELSAMRAAAGEQSRGFAQALNDLGAFLTDELARARASWQAAESKPEAAADQSGAARMLAMVKVLTESLHLMTQELAETRAAFDARLRGLEENRGK